MLNVMIDLETLGVSPDAPILSIGATYFDPGTGKLGKVLSLKLGFVEACTDRKIDPDTVAWWLEQSDEARNALLSRGEGSCVNGDKFGALRELTRYLEKACIVWGNGATFDISMLENLYRQLGMAIPWKFYNVRDVRTIVAAAEGIVDREDFLFEGVKHDALSDAIHQATYVSAMWQALRKS